MKVEYVGEGYGKSTNEKHLKIFIFLAFLLILLFIIFTSFPGSFPVSGSIITGGAIGNSFNNENTNNIKFESELTIPELSIDGKFDKVEIEGSSNSFLQVGNQKFDLGNVNNNFLVFKNFDGVISFDEKEITELKGKVSEVTINGVLVIPTKETTKVNFIESFNYEFLDISNGVSIKEIVYVTSGLIKLNNEKEIFNINDEEVIIKNFYGSIMIDNGKFNAMGSINELSIIGKLNINIKAYD